MQNDPYRAVIADLKAKRDELDKTIKSLEALSGGAIPTGGKTSSAVTNTSGDEASRTDDSPTVGESDFLGKSIPDAVLELLGRERRKMRVADIARSLMDGGMEFSSDNPKNSIGSVLNRRQKQVGDIVSPERGYWGLKEWYPGRTFGKKPKEDEAETKSETSEPSPPSSQENVVPMGTNRMPGIDLL